MEYDVPALEKHLVDRFIHGKPFLQLEILQVAYRKDVYTAEAFANIRKNVKPQVHTCGVFCYEISLVLVGIVGQK